VRLQESSHERRRPKPDVGDGGPKSQQMKPETHVDLEGEQQWCKIADPQATPERLLPPPTISDPLIFLLEICSQFVGIFVQPITA
jgi:hypothetical protein